MRYDSLHSYPRLSSKRNMTLPLEKDWFPTLLQFSPFPLRSPRITRRSSRYFYDHPVEYRYRSRFQIRRNRRNRNGQRWIEMRRRREMTCRPALRTGMRNSMSVRSRWFDSDLGCEAWYQWSRTSFTQRPLERRIHPHCTLRRYIFQRLDHHSR